jgi:membrane-associated phospholipid phosphatase
MRRQFVLASLVLYLLVAVSSATGILRTPDTHLARDVAAPVRQALGPAACFADLAGGLTATGIAAAVLPLGFRGVSGWRRLGMFAGWAGLSLAEALQKGRVPVPGPGGAIEGPNAFWCNALHAVADRPVLAVGGAALAAVEYLMHRPVTRRAPSLPYTFPSGHSTRSLYVLGLLAAGYWGGSPLGWGVAGLAALAEGWVLTAAHWHWASDVVGGWLMAGIALALVLPRRR